MTPSPAMVRKSKPGDEVLFSYSSPRHPGARPAGTEAPGDKEPDGLDEAFACYDIARGRPTAGTATRSSSTTSCASCSPRRPRGCSSRCCSTRATAASGTRGPRRHPARPAARPASALPAAARPRRRWPRRARSGPPTPQASTARRCCRLVKSRGTEAKPVLFAACRPTRRRRTRSSAGDPTGPSPTSSSRRSRRTRRHPRPSCTSAVTAGLKAEDFEQRSTLEGPVKAKKAAFGQLW